MGPGTTFQVIGIVLVLAGVIGGFSVARWSNDTGKIDYPFFLIGSIIANRARFDVAFSFLQFQRETILAFL